MQEAIVKYVKGESRINKMKLFVHGRSLGGAVAIYTVQQYPELFRGMIIENTFTSIEDMADQLFFFARHVKQYILRNHWRSIDIVDQITLPALYVTGDADELVPFEMTQVLYQRSRNTKFKNIYVVKGGTHNDTWYVGGQRYLDKLEEFIWKALNAVKETSTDKQQVKNEQSEQQDIKDQRETVINTQEL
ncbi:hydrolase of the alpha beta superfamily [Stylonychia lemnae]|uniref:Hydrolase of the alpha beta superfamily n=1 Tax=Stylonychia lemnae TaxID=5949 RepID=A0A078ADH1_STYLE|nr:hydrolase of the alpha beta superfamily [Stylonychia lemnae]|eukprot:CDW78903.1 hydrolase of the alpha beta superfamily [Stylonychia lemnae]